MILLAFWILCSFISLIIGIINDINNCRLITLVKILEKFLPNVLLGPISLIVNIIELYFYIWRRLKYKKWMNKPLFNNRSKK